MEDVYVVADYQVWEDEDRRTDVEGYLEAWLTDPSRRQIALLGHYGQGKSTCSLMFAYHLINRAGGPPRVPILIELRGRGPRNMSPATSWASGRMRTTSSRLPSSCSMKRGGCS